MAERGQGDPLGGAVDRRVRADRMPGDPAELRGLGWWRDRTVVDDFLEHSARQPGKTAVVSRRGDRNAESFTYREFAGIVDRFASVLLELGVRPGEAVSFQLPNWWQFAAVHLACGRIGAVSNPVLPILRSREVAFICDRLRSRVLITPGTFRGHDYAAMAAGIAASVGTLEHVLVAGEAPEGLPGTRRLEELAAAVAVAPNLDALRPSPDDPAQVGFTSGTTGEPKGVVHTWNTVYAGMRPSYEAARLTPDDVLLAFSPLGHTVGFYYGVTMPFLYGMTVVYQDTWDPAAALELIAEHGVTWTMAAPTFLADLCAAGSARPVRSLSRISCAGAPIPPDLVGRVRERLGARLLAVWGMTEVGALSTTRLDDDPLRAAESDGGPMPWNELKIADKTGRELPHGQEGRLLARGASLLVGYHGRRDLLDAAIDADGWFDTGDLARMDDDGYIRICGRTKDIVVRGGENVPVVEVEGELVRHPAIRDVAVVGAPDPRLGERAVAVVVPADPRQPPDLRDLQAHLRAAGMATQFWPEHLVLADSLPRTATGKVQKFLLRADVAGVFAGDTPKTTILEPK
ncbi:MULTISPECIES: AMP-binding protein [Amycolatopsis]|uniref:AMP-binding protein n=1 Tax=Amycolatopsis echigonensis TaxID=2576905 RepID=A0A8E1VUD7_9PSEU|nr:MULTISPECIES: AMP-binding protein [Amycolatopsis]MBB2498448.1 AMP-binding protein [Amycolatopsis echigonensis]